MLDFENRIIWKIGVSLIHKAEQMDRKIKNKNWNKKVKLHIDKFHCVPRYVNREHSEPNILCWNYWIIKIKIFNAKDIQAK